MFAGENLQKRADRVMRQWLTRLYYLAHSPFKVTWALDSNVLSCTPGAAQAFLDAALATDLWGFHIAHGSQNIASPTMYPHNWNLAFRSDAMVVGLMREWFSLQVQQGVASDDQSTLHVAELYFRKAYGKRGFRVGQIERLEAESDAERQVVGETSQAVPGAKGKAELLRMLRWACEDEVAHKEEAQQRSLDPRGGQPWFGWVDPAWQWLVGKGSAAAAGLVRRL